MASQCALPAPGRSHAWHYTRAGLWLLDATRSWGRAVPKSPIRMGDHLRALPGESARGGPSVFREAEPADIDELARAMRVGRECVDLRFAVGKRCFVAGVEETIACYAWVTEGEEAVPELEQVVRPSSGEAYVWDCYTMPEFRGRALLSSTLDLMRRSLGGLRYWAVILAGNRSSERAFSKSGYTPVETLRYLRVGGFARLWLDPLPETPPAISRNAATLFGR